MTPISEQVLERIKEQRIKPMPRWRFLVSEGLRLTALAAAVVAGSLAVSATFELFTDYEWEEGVYQSDQFALFAIRGIPYFWLAVLGIFLLAAMLDFSATNQGYRYRHSAVVAVCLAVSLVIGTALFASGYGETIDDSMEKAWPSYRQMVWRRSDVWTQPDAGLLGGVVEEVGAPGELRLRGFDQRVWTVHYPTNAPTDQPIPKRDEAVRLIGRPNDDVGFDAKEVRPWRGRQPSVPVLDKPTDCLKQPVDEKLEGASDELKEKVRNRRIKECGSANGRGQSDRKNKSK